MRASEPVSCWPHKPREWRSTRQPATKLLGESFNGRTAGLQPANEGSTPSSSTNSPGRPLRSRRQSEKLDTHVRLVPLAPSVTVAEWLRRATVDRSTRVQFSPVTPSLGGRSAARTQVFEACYGSSSLPLPTRLSALSGGCARQLCGRRSTDQDTRLRTGRLEVQILPPVPNSARRPRERAQPSEG